MEERDYKGKLEKYVSIVIATAGVVIVPGGLPTSLILGACYIKKRYRKKKEIAIAREKESPLANL